MLAGLRAIADHPGLTVGPRALPRPALTAARPRHFCKFVRCTNLRVTPSSTCSLTLGKGPRRHDDDERDSLDAQDSEPIATAGRARRRRPRHARPGGRHRARPRARPPARATGRRPCCAPPHPGAARATDGQAFRGGTTVHATRTAAPTCGCERTLRRRCPSSAATSSCTRARRRLGGRQPDPRRPAALVDAPAVEHGRGRGRRAGPGATAAASATCEADGAPRLVVDATRRTPRLAWEVITGGIQADGTPSRLATYVDARTGEVHPPRAADRDRRRVRPVALRRHRAAAARRVRVDVPAQGPDPRQHLHHRHGQQDRLDAAASSSAAAARPARCSPSPDTSVRQRHDQQPRVGGRRRAVRHQRDLGLLQERPRPQRHLRQRQGLLQPGPLRQELRQRVLGRHQDDLRRRRRRQLRPADLARRGRPRDVARRHREHRGPHLLRRVRRPQRGDLGHLRHDGGVLRQQRRTTRATT